MIVSLFTKARDNVPKVRNVTWDEFVEGLGPHREMAVSDKRDLPAFSPAEFLPGATKAAPNVVRVHFGALDFDHLNPHQVETVAHACDGLNAVLLSTWSHARDPWRLRLVVELSRPIERVEFDPWWPVLRARFGGLADPQTKNADRIFFGAFCPPGTLAQQFFVRFHGKPLDVASLPQVALAAPVAVAGTEKISRERLATLAKTWKRSRDEYRQTLGQALERVARGEPFADPGSRDTMAFQLTRDLIRAWPDADPLSLAEHFAPSIQIMGWDGDISAKLSRAQDEIQAEQTAREVAEMSETKLRISECFLATEPGRDWPYTAQELAALAKRCKTTPENLKKRWIIQRGTQFYILGPRGYSPPYGEKDVWTATLRDLAPARSAGVSLFEVDERGHFARKGLPTLMAEYGTIATDHVLDLRAQEARYDSATGTFVEAPTPIRAGLVAEYSPLVAGWLERLGSPQILDWLAFSTDLGSTCVALVLTGPGGTGKSLLAHAAARIFTTTQPTALDQVLGNWNEALARCPIVLADEAIPKDFRGQSRTPELREFLGSMSRPFRKKYAPDSVIIGSPRLIITANNEDVLSFSENLSRNDLEAIAARFLHVRIPGTADFCAARDYLQKLGQATVATFVTHDLVAKHILWLRDNHPAKRQGRFLIVPQTKTGDPDTIRTLATKGGVRSSLCQWLVGYLKNPAPFDARGTFLVRVRGGGLYVNTQGIAENWTLYVENEQIPTVGKLAQAIGNLADGERTTLSRPGKASPVHYRKVDVQNLIAWAEHTEYASAEEIQDALSTDTETRARGFQLFSGTRPN